MKTFFGHPRGLAVLFFSEMWERFSYYGMRALLTLYMVKELSYKDDVGAGIYGAYTALVYVFPVIGGWLAERVLGYRRAIILGGLFMALGHGLMAIQNEGFFFTALAFLCVGNGFFKPNISSTVGKLYEQGDPLRDSGFTIFYMGINLGALLAPLVCGKLGENVGWHWGFGAAAIGMLFGLAVFMWGTSTLEGKGEPRDPATLKLAPMVWLGSFLVIPLVYLLLKNHEVAKYLVYSAGVVVLFVLASVAFKEGKVGRERLFALIILMFFHMMFWSFFEQAGSSLTLFTDRAVNRDMPIVGEQPASVFQAMNPFFILLFAPIFTIIWGVLTKRNMQPSIPMKFALGLLQLGLGFGLLVWAMNSADPGQRTGWFFIMMMYLLHTTGELCISPVGLSAVTKLAPEKLVGFVMGSWFLSIAFGNMIAGQIAKLTKVEFTDGSALDAITRGTFKMGEGDGATLASLEHGNALKEPKTLIDVIKTFGDKELTPQVASPQAVLEHVQTSGQLSPEVVTELGGLIGNEGTEGAAAALDAHAIPYIFEAYQPIYQNVFYGAMACGVLLLVLSPFIKKLMHGVE